MANTDNNNKLLIRYGNKERRNILTDPYCKINGIDFKEIYSLNALSRSYNRRPLSKDNNNTTLSSNIHGPSTQTVISKENDSVIIILYFFKPLHEKLDKNNILIQGNNNNNNIVVKSVERGDLLRDLLIQKGDTKSKKDNIIGNIFFSEESKDVLLKLLSRVDVESETLYSTENGSIKTNKLDSTLIVFLDKINDDSLYTLKIVEHVYDEENSEIPPKNFDLVFSQIDFRFQFIEDNNVFDCKSDLNSLNCSNFQSNSLNPNIDYLSKDYSSFRRLMLDRINLIAPQWNEQSPADIGIVLVELLAYVGDHLSYFQDAVGTEAYLGTARSRVSLKRHARLLNYNVNDGCNARVWVCLDVNPMSNNANESEKGIIIPKKTQLLTFADNDVNINENTTDLTITNDRDFQNALNNGSEVFETIYDKILYPQHNTINFYTWGRSQYILYKGATNATLINDNLKLKLNNGDVLIFEETRSPKTFLPQDADPSHRHAVRINNIEYLTDYLYNPPISVIDISWNEDDALPFSLCIAMNKNNDNNSTSNIFTDDSNILNSKNDKNNNENEFVYSSVAHGNIVLADHGYTVYEIFEETPKEGKFNPKLSLMPITNTNFDHYYSDNVISATNSINYNQQFTKPVIDLREIISINDGKNNDQTNNQLTLENIKRKNNYYISPINFQKAITDNIKGFKIGEQKWKLSKDIFDLNGFDNGFVAEMESDGTVYIRFGDGYNGQAPMNSSYIESHIFCAIYRVGNGVKGNVNAESISRIRIDDNSPLMDKIIKVRNPLEARNALDPEPTNNIRQFASGSIKKLNRAVTEDDYLQILQSHPEIKSAVAAIEWTGTWYVISIVIERYERKHIDNEFKDKIILFIESYRLSGYDLKITGPIYVPLDIKIKIKIDDNYFQNEIRYRLLEVFGKTSMYCSNIQTKGLFHPDNLHLGQQIFYDRIHDTAMSVAGVKSVSFNRFQRLELKNLQGTNEINPELRMAKNEIPIIDNDPANPNNGRIEFVLEGGL